MDTQANDLRDGRLSELRADIELAEPGSPGAVAAQREIAALTEQIDTLEKNAHTLDQAARDVKTIWENKDYRRGGGDPYKMVSRLALVSHLMGETPLFNCKSGKDRTGQLDAEVKFLATVADEQRGRIPSVDRNMEVWRSARSDFTLNTGNLEMQQLNTGLPGYKLKGVSGLKEHDRGWHDAGVPGRVGLRLRIGVRPGGERVNALIGGAGGGRDEDLARVVR